MLKARKEQKEINGRQYFKTKIQLYIKIVNYLLFIISVGIFIFICNTAYKYTIKPIKIEQIPLIKKNQCTAKQEAKDGSGGITVSHQNKMIYNNFKPSTTTNKLQSLSDSKKLDNLTHDEEILKILRANKLTEQLKEQGKLSNANSEQGTAKNIEQSYIAENNATTADQIRNTNTIKDNNSVFDVITDEQSSVLFGTFGSKAAALSRWQNLIKQHSLLRSSTSDIRKINKGQMTYYQLYLSQNINIHKAKSICQKLNRLNQECTIVKPTS